MINEYLNECLSKYGDLFSSIEQNIVQLIASKDFHAVLVQIRATNILVNKKIYIIEWMAQIS